MMAENVEDPRSRFIEQLREMTRSNREVNEVAWSVMSTRGCESYGELYDELTDTERAEMVGGLRELLNSMSSPAMQQRFK